MFLSISAPFYRVYDTACHTTTTWTAATTPGRAHLAHHDGVLLDHVPTADPRRVPPEQPPHHTALQPQVLPPAAALLPERALVPREPQDGRPRLRLRDDRQQRPHRRGQLPSGGHFPQRRALQLVALPPRGALAGLGAVRARAAAGAGRHGALVPQAPGARLAAGGRGGDGQDGVGVERQACGGRVGRRGVQGAALGVLADGEGHGICVLVVWEGMRRVLVGLRGFCAVTSRGSALSEVLSGGGPEVA